MSRIETIRSFYKAFSKQDYQTMNSHYTQNIYFHDPAFRQLHGDEVRAMWHMLCAAARDLKIECTSAEEKDGGVRATWEAWYTFSGTGRRVHNRINAQFEFEGDLIVNHIDRFDMWRWTRMALGTPGVLLGWTPMLKNKVTSTARNNLKKFMKENPEYSLPDQLG